MGDLSLFAIRVIYYFVKKVMDKGLVAKLEKLIIVMFSSTELSGIEKRAQVEKQIKLIGGDIAEAFAATAGTTMDILFASIVRKYQLENPEEFK